EHRRVVDPKAYNLAVLAREASRQPPGHADVAVVVDDPAKDVPALGGEWHRRILVRLRWGSCEYSSWAERSSLDAPLPTRRSPRDPLPETLDLSMYGALKAACETEVERAFGDRALLVRPGLIVGPGDRTDRFTWWPARIAKGGRVAAPGRPARPVQFIDVRDL